MSAARPMLAFLIAILLLLGFSISANVTPNPERDSAPGMKSEAVVLSNLHGHLATSQVAKGWQLGEPDLIVKLREPYLLPQQNSDVFRNFVIPNVSASDRYVRALEFRPGNLEVVHHAEFRIDETEASWRRDKEEVGSGYAGMDNATAYYPDGHFVNWVPGKHVSEVPEGFAWRLPAQADLVVQLHMMPSGFEEVIDPPDRIVLYRYPPRTESADDLARLALAAYCCRRDPL